MPEEHEQEQRTAVLEPSAWKNILGYLRPHRRMLIAGGVLVLIGNLAGLIQPVAAGMIVDALEVSGPVLRPLLLLTVAVILGAGIGAFGYFILARIAESVVLDSRRRLIRRILWLRVSDISRYQPGDLLARVTADTTLLRQVTSQALVESVTGALMLVAIIVMMGVMDLVLLLVTLGVLASAAVILVLVFPRIQRYSDRVQGAVGSISTYLERTLGTFRTIKASGAEHEEAARAEGHAVLAWRHGLNVARLEALSGTGVNVAIQFAFLVVLGVGGARVASGSIDVGTLIAFLLYLFYLIPPVGSLVTAVQGFNVGAAALTRIREVLQLETEPVAGSTAVAPDPSAERPGADGRNAAPASVTFEDVVFGYPGGGALVHHGVGFDIPAGGLTALVGPSGAGKSTVFALLERFYDASGGRILVDGRDITEWPLDELRRTIGYVEQDAPVLAGTLRENLLIGAPPGAREEIPRALAKARLDRFVDQLPQGLDTQVGHRGSNLSGGERQRIAIARALLRSPRLLLLDEATSQLDALNELALREVVADLGRESTVLVVAHRLSTVTMADRILVMDAGRVRAVGTHAELVKGDALYRELASTQLLVAEDPDVADVAEDHADTLAARDSS